MSEFGWYDFWCLVQRSQGHAIIWVEDLTNEENEVDFVFRASIDSWEKGSTDDLLWRSVSRYEIKHLSKFWIGMQETLWYHKKYWLNPSGKNFKQKCIGQSWYYLLPKVTWSLSIMCSRVRIRLSDYEEMCCFSSIFGTEAHRFWS